jgi:hypothetical protein
VEVMPAALNALLLGAKKVNVLFLSLKLIPKAVNVADPALVTKAFKKV